MALQPMQHQAPIGAREADICRRAVLVWLLYKSAEPRLTSEGLMPLLMQVGAECAWLCLLLRKHCMPSTDCDQSLPETSLSEACLR